MSDQTLPEYELRNRHFDQLIQREQIKWLGQNTNHAEPHPAVRAAMLDCIHSGEIHLYAPPLGLEALRTAILQDLGLTEGFSVLVTDGAIEGLYHACRTFLDPGDDFLVTDPGWLWPRRFAASSGARVVEIPIYERPPGYRLHPAQLREAITPHTKLLYLVDPNNPLGSVQTESEIHEIASIAEETGFTLIHDCTYRHFASDHTLAARHYPEGTITTYSFSKWLGIAGLRLGAVVAAPAIIERLAAAPPNNLGASILAQRAAVAGLAHKAEWFSTVNDEQRANQAHIKGAVEQVAGLRILVYPSGGNFVAIDVSEAGVFAEQLCEFYLSHDILIRQGSYHTDRCGERFIKVSTTVPVAWVEAFCSLLGDAVEACRGRPASVALF